MADILDQYGISPEPKKRAVDVLDEYGIEAPSPFINTPPEQFGAPEKMFIENSGETVDAPAGSGAFFTDVLRDDTFDGGEYSSAFEEASAAFEKQAAYLAWVAVAMGTIPSDEAATFIADRSKALASAQERAPEYVKRYNQDWQNAKGFFQSTGVILSNPRAIGRSAITQAPNSLFPLISGFAGAVAGSPAGPLGAVVGSGVGGLTGSAITEVGASIDELLAENGVDTSNAAQLIAAFENEALMADIRVKATKKGLTTAAVDTMLTLVGGKFTRNMLTNAKRVVANTTSQTIADRLAVKAIQGGAWTGGVTIDAIGEGVSEAAGQAVGYGEVDWGDVVQEAITSPFQSAGQTAIGVAARSVKPRNNGDAVATEAAPVAENATTAPAETTTSYAGETLQSALSRMDEGVEFQEMSSGAIQFFNDVSAGKPADVYSLAPSDQKFVVDLISSQVEKQIDVLSAQTGDNFVPVPKRQEGLSEFLRSKGGLRADTGETQRFTRKESPSLKGVAKKNGLLDLDTAREMAAEAGFISENADINELISALEREARGEEVVSAANLTEAQTRQQIIEYNAQLAERNDLVMQNNKDIRTFKEALRRGAIAARQDVKAVQATLISALAKTPLTAGDKSKFMNAIKNVQTSEQLQKAIPKIEKRVNALVDAESKRKIRDEIKKLISSAKKSQKIAAETLDDIRALEDRLKARGVLSGQAEAAAGDVKQSIRDMSVRELQAALADVVVLTKEGRAQQVIKQELKAARQRAIIDELRQDTVAIQPARSARGKIGEKVSAYQELKNKINRGANIAQEKNLAKNPMDCAFDALDGFKDYMGANFRNFKGRLDARFGAYLDKRFSITDRILKLRDELKLEKHNQERIGVWAILNQEGGYDHLIGSGLSREDILEIQKRFENGGINDEAKRELRLYDAMIAELAALRDPINYVMKNVYNKEIGKVQNYFPFMTDFDAMRDFEVQDIFSDDAFVIKEGQKPFNRKDVSKGFTKERKGGKTAVKIDAMQVFIKHVDNASYLIEMAQDIKELGEIASSDDYRTIAGEVGQEMVVDWINLMARKGNVGDRIQLFDTMRKNTGAAILGFKLSSILIQPTALADGASLLGGRWVSGGIKDVVASKEWRQFVVANMPELRERIGDDVAFIEMQGDGLIGKAREAGMYMLKKLDAFAASSVAIAAYKKNLSDRGIEVDFSNPDAEAIAFAQLITRRTQSSSFFKDAPAIISQGKLTGNVSVDKLILQFQSFMLNRWSLIEHDMIRAGFMGGRTKQAMNIAVWITLANVSEYYVRHWTKEMLASALGSEPPEEEDFAPAAIKQALSNVPFVSSLVSSAQYGSVPVPSVSFIENIMNSIKYAWQSKSGEKKAKHFANASILSAGAIFGIPGTLQAQDVVRKVTSEKPKKSSNSLASQ